MSLLKWIFGTKPKAKPGKIVDLNHAPPPEPEQKEHANGNKTLSELIANTAPPSAKKPRSKPPPPNRSAPSKRYPQGQSMAQKEKLTRPSRAQQSTYNLNSPISFSYRDSQGRITDRTVTPISYDGECIEARCHLRKAQRTFYLNRILGDIAMKDTGEVLTIYEWELTIE